jgi:hypothetical protein
LRASGSLMDLRLRSPNENGRMFRGTAVVCSKFHPIAKAGLGQGRLERSGMCRSDREDSRQPGR